jgi:hypothetical protein
MLAAGPPSGFITDIVGCWGEPCGELAISLHSHTFSLVQWVNPLFPDMRDLGSIPRGHLCETEIVLLALSRYKRMILLSTWKRTIIIYIFRTESLAMKDNQQLFCQ